jgi:iron complex outermembrane receptor protein
MKHSNLHFSFPKFLFSPGAFLALLFSLSQLSAERADNTLEVHDLDPFVVNATTVPRSSRDMLNPASVLTGQELDSKRSATIGETLEGQAGIHASAFGAGASRPIIRGFEGPRIRVMESGIGNGDLSADSPDHAAAVEPFFAERIEILRGPSTLLFGSSAIGGVVNVVDRRIPRNRSEDPWSGELLLDYNSSSDGVTGAGFLSGNLDEISVAVSFLKRDLEDYSIPGPAELHGEDETEGEEDHHFDEEIPTGVLENSFSKLKTNSIGVSWLPENGTRVSLAWIASDSQYGVPGHEHEQAEHEGDEDHDEREHEEGEDSVWIDLKHTSWDFEFEHPIRGAWIETVEGRVRYVDYEHQEMEGDALGTAFANELWEARFTASYAIRDSHPGTLGSQIAYTDSSADGEEALTPPSQTRDASLFILQEWVFNRLRFEAGLRGEYREINAEDRDGYDGLATSVSLGAHYKIGKSWSVGLLLNRSQRHPTSTELYADGPHAATRQFELGNPNLEVETANGVDLSLQFQSALFDFGVTAFYNDFSDYIYAAPTEDVRDGLTVYQFGAVDARFHGMEAQGTWHLFHSEKSYFDLGVLFDWVEADIAGSADNLPRIPPARAGLRAVYAQSLWSVRSTLRHAFKQNDTAPFETLTAAYTDWSVDLSLTLPFTKSKWTLLVTGENLLDEDIRYHTSPIKDVAPLPGRHIRVSMSVVF